MQYYILFLARIVPEKGLDYLLEAYKNIDTDMKLVIAGGASHTNSYYDEVVEKAKQDERIVLTGFVQGEELQELYSNCYLYCLPSDVEGMPISLMEAMSYGRRCLTSDIEENTQVTGSYGMSFKKSDVEDLKKQLENAISSDSSEKWRKPEEISNYILKKYDWDKVVEETKKLYRK